MNVLHRMMDIVNNEDPKNPYTDDQIARFLGVSREKITEERIRHDVPDSRERRKAVLLGDALQVLKDNPAISERQFCKQLCDLGYKISRHIAASMKNELLQERSTTPAQEGEGGRDEQTKAVVPEPGRLDQNTPFQEMIGSEGSLRTQISQAKAAVFYPPHGLHTLILGPSGAGKSQLAEAMYQFAVVAGNFQKNAPFIVFNCADYADNPQLLLSQLFGHEKGAFTGATASKTGLVEKADGGILFLDEIHRLPQEGQEILFSLLDRGTFRRLGETESVRKSRVMLIGATTENPESSLLLTLRRRIPMVIGMPALKDRPAAEICEIIRNFFMTEALRIGKPLLVKSDALKALMLYEYPGNVGQLRSDIQVACARSLLNFMRQKRQEIVIELQDLPDHIQMGLLKVSRRNPEITKLLLNVDMHIDLQGTSPSVPTRNRYILPVDIYQFIEERFFELEQKGLSKDEIENIVGVQVDNELKKFVRTVNTNIMSFKSEVEEIVGVPIAKVVNFVVDIAKRDFPLLKENIFYSLSIHLYTAYNRLKSGKTILNPNLATIIREHPAEYETATQMARHINEQLHITLPEDEIGFIALYIHAFAATGTDDARVGVLVITHGQVAKGLADVANKLLGVDHAVGIEMDLNEKPSDILNKVVEVVQSMDQGKGCLLLVDLGSLVTFGEIVTRRTGIPTRTIGRVDTVMVLEAVRRAMIPDAGLHDIAAALEGEKALIGRTEDINKQHQPKAILSVCITGEGTAGKLKQYVENLLPEIGSRVQILPLGVINQRNLSKQVEELQQNFRIIACMGTLRPEKAAVPFISLEEVISGVGLEKISELAGLPKTRLSPLRRLTGEMLEEGHILCHVAADTKNDAIDYLVEILEKKGYVEKQFLLSVYKREALGSTVFENEIAIPHGDTKYVTKSSVVIATLAQPVEWQNEVAVRVIFLFALKEDAAWYVDALYDVMASKKYREKLRSAKDARQVTDIIHQARHMAAWETMELPATEK